LQKRIHARFRSAFDESFGAKYRRAEKGSVLRVTNDKTCKLLRRKQWILDGNPPQLYLLLKIPGETVQASIWTSIKKVPRRLWELWRFHVNQADQC